MKGEGQVEEVTVSGVGKEHGADKGQDQQGGLEPALLFVPGGLEAYLDRLALLHGYLVIFDRSTSSGPLAERIHTESARTPKDRPVTVLRA